MTDKPLFTQDFDSALYTLKPSRDTVGWVGFIYRSDNNPPATLSLSDAFNKGYFLFSPCSPPLTDKVGAETFITAVQEWLNDKFGVGSPQRFSGSAVLWIPETATPTFGAADETTVTFFQGLSATSTASNYNLHFGQRLTLSIPQQVILTMRDEGLVFRQSGAQQIVFITDDGIGAPEAKGDLVIPFQGDLAGCLTVQGLMTRTNMQSSPISYFETGFHYLYTDSKGNTQRQIYPLFKVAKGLPSLNFSAVLDPLDKLNNGALSNPGAGLYRSLFGFADGIDIASWFCDKNGHPVGLVAQGGYGEDGLPVRNCGALVFQSRGRASDPLSQVYFAPAGDYAFSTDDTGLVLPGLFGSELFQIDPYQAGASYDRVQFQPNCSAYAPIFPFPSASLDDPGAAVPKQRLVTDYTTSHGAIINGPNGAATYLAQPQGSPLYAPTADATAGNLAVLPPLPTPSPIAQPTNEKLLLPFAPYAGLTRGNNGFADDLVGTFESQILSAERKTLLGVSSMRAVAQLRAAKKNSTIPNTHDVTHQSTTPQGLYAEIATASSGGAEALYQKIFLAKSNAKKPATGEVDFGFLEPDANLQNLFQTNQLLAVIVNPGHLGEPSPADASAIFERNVVIADWGMTAAVGNSLNTTAYSNILILKYCDGSLTERVKNPNQWVGVDDFSLTGKGDAATALAGLSSYLQTYLSEGIKEAEERGNTLYANFAQIVQDPNWQGFIVLKAKVDPSGFPDQIKGLTAGIDFSRFEAHHFGATASRVSVDGTQITMQVPSSLFGLIDYQLPQYQAYVAAGGNPEMPQALATQGDFGFTVLQLQALFENAALTDFRSRIQLTMNQLFMSPVTTGYGSVGKLPATAVVLRGSYQRQGATPVYVFEQNSTNVFELNNSALPSLALQRVVFNTLSTDKGGTIRSRFVISGIFEFAQLSVAVDKATRHVDLLSFGLPEGAKVNDTPSGLAFSGLEVAMSSPLDAPNAVTFTFETERLGLDAGASKARDHSLFKDLALSVSGFIAGAEDKRPIDFGYLPVGIEPKIQAISGPWYGISYTVTMGTPGALVSAAGFSSKMLLAWAPSSVKGAAAPAVFVGLQLPGAAPGAKLLSIQGVMKLSIDSLLLRQEAIVSNQKAFVLRLNNIALSFLGLAKLPSSPINFFLFGDPTGGGALGWYAAYVDKDAVQKELLAPVKHIGHAPDQPQDKETSS